MQTHTEHTAPLTGIDLLIARGPDLDAVVRAVETIANIERAALMLPGEPDEKIIATLDHPRWAAIHAYAAGDFAFKVDLYGRTPRDYHDIARQFAAHLHVLVAWPDERTLATTTFIACEPDGAEYDIVCDDAEPDGLTLRRLSDPLTRGDVNAALSDALWCQPHNVKQRYEIYDRALNNELEFDLRAVDDAILDAVRELGERGIPMNHANLQFDLHRYYPPILPTLVRRIFGRNVTAPDLYFDEIADAIWNAIPAEFKTGHSS